MGAHAARAAAWTSPVSISAWRCAPSRRLRPKRCCLVIDDLDGHDVLQAPRGATRCPPGTFLSVDQSRTDGEQCSISHSVQARQLVIAPRRGSDHVNRFLESSPVASCIEKVWRFTAANYKGGVDAGKFARPC